MREQDGKHTLMNVVSSRAMLPLSIRYDAALDEDKN